MRPFLPVLVILIATLFVSINASAQYVDCQRLAPAQAGDVLANIASDAQAQVQNSTVTYTLTIQDASTGQSQWITTSQPAQYLQNYAYAVGRYTIEIRRENQLILHQPLEVTHNP